MDAFIGTILVWPISWAPDCWKTCDGTVLNVNQYEALFSLVGGMYGGDARTTFGIPDLRGRTPIGVNMTSSTGLPINTLSAKAGSSTLTISANNLPLHNHGASFAPVLGNQTVTIPAVPAAGSLSVNVGGKVNTSAAGAPVPGSGANVYLGGMSAVGGLDPVTITGPYNGSSTATTANLQGLSGSVTPSSGYTPGSPATTVTIPSVTGGAVAVGAGGGVSSPLPLNNYQPSLALNFIIALMGIYPVRS